MISKIKRFLLPLITLFFCAASASAAESDSIASLQRTVIGSYRLEFGSRRALSTYLSPFFYRGSDFAVSGFWTKVLPVNPEHLAMHFEGRASFGNLLNPAHTAREIDFHTNVQWGLLWQRRFAPGWLLGAGGSAGVYGGALYLPRNGNNPASAQFAVGLAANGYVSRLFRIGSLPVTISDRLNLPLMGGFFSQDYGESYYEIYLGNRNRLAHCGWLGNRFGIDNLLTISFDLGRTALEVGYRFSMQNEYANNLTTRIFNNAFVVGVIPGGLGIKSGKRNIITPLH